MLRQRLEPAGPRLAQACQRLLQRQRRHLEYCQAHLAQLNPLAILARGYAVATLLPGGGVIREATQAPPGSAIRVQVARGGLDSPGCRNA